jgi:hypothetical protein
MITLLAQLTAWLVAGAAILTGLYWLLLNTPESNAAMLAASAVTALAILIVTAIVVNAGVLMALGHPLSTALRRAAGAIHWFVLALVPTAIAWWLLLQAGAWTAEHSGEVGAWFIARFGWADINWLFQAQAWISRWVRWIVMPLASLSWLALRLRPAPVGFGNWVRGAWHWRTLLPASLAFAVLATIPGALVAWRPSMPPTWIEPTVSALRLGIATVLWCAGAALLIALSAAAPTHTRPLSREPEPEGTQATLA